MSLDSATALHLPFVVAMQIDKEQFLFTAHNMIKTSNDYNQLLCFYVLIGFNVTQTLLEYTYKTSQTYFIDAVG